MKNIFLIAAALVVAAAIFFAGFNVALRLPRDQYLKYQLEIITSPQP